MSDESSLSPGVVRGPDGTQAEVTDDGLAVTSDSLIEAINDLTEQVIKLRELIEQLATA